MDGHGCIQRDGAERDNYIWLPPTPNLQISMAYVAIVLSFDAEEKNIVQCMLKYSEVPLFKRYKVFLQMEKWEERFFSPLFIF